MRALIQRVRYAKVGIGGQTHSEIGTGLLVFLGVCREDEGKDASSLARKTARLRVFPDAAGKLNLSLLEMGGEALVVSQFTLYGDCSKGLRPGFERAAPAAQAKELYEKFIAELTGEGIPVKSGVFQVDMLVELANDGPVTLLLESR